MDIFGLGKRPDPVDQAKSWKRNIAREIRTVERDIANIKRQEEKARRDCKKLAASGQLSAARVLAREIVQTQKAIERMYMAKANMNSVSMQLQAQMSTIKVQGCIRSSTEVMHQMSNLVKLPEVTRTMTEMAREMEKAGLIEEVTNDAFSSLDAEGTESEVNSAVDRVIMELTNEVLQPAAEAPTTRVPTTALPEMEAKQELPPAADEDFQRMQERLQAL